MTREERARKVLGQHLLAKPWGNAGYDATFWRTARVTFDEAIAACLAFADAEAAAVRERAAMCAQDEADDIRAAGQEKDPWQRGRMVMADTIATAIRALPTTEVGNG